jgi:quercetin dioxygenase-like cupin family protein
MCATATPALSQEISVEPLLQTDKDTVGRPLEFPDGAPTIKAVIATIPPGTTTGWHEHPVPVYFRMLEGELTVDYGSKGVKVYRVGDTAIEAVNWPHNGTNKGDVPVRVLAVHLGSSEKRDPVAVDGPK